MKEIQEKEAHEKERTKEKQKNSIKNMAQIKDNLHREQNEWCTSSSNRSTVAPFWPPISEPAKSAEPEECIVEIFATAYLIDNQESQSLKSLWHKSCIVTLVQIEAETTQSTGLKCMRYLQVTHLVKVKLQT